MGFRPLVGGQRVSVLVLVRAIFCDVPIYLFTFDASGTPDERRIINCCAARIRDVFLVCKRIYGR
jgi:hypothetical protein